MSICSTTSLSGGHKFMSVWLSKSSQEDKNLCPFDQLRVYQEDINLCPFAQLRVYQEDINLCPFG